MASSFAQRNLSITQIHQSRSIIIAPRAKCDIIYNFSILQSTIKCKKRSHKGRGLATCRRIKIDAITSIIQHQYTNTSGRRGATLSATYLGGHLTFTSNHRHAVNSRPSTHIHLRNLFISLHNLIITYIPLIAMYKQLNLPPILYLCLVLMGLRGGCGVGAAGCLWIGSSVPPFVVSGWLWSCRVWNAAEVGA